MPPTLAPFLYQTRTLQRAWRSSLLLPFLRSAHTNRPGGSEPYGTGSIPFEWEGEAPPSDRRRRGRGSSDMTFRSMQEGRGLTLSPSEAHIFKRIFDEIAQGKMPPSTTRRRGSQSSELPPRQEDPRRNLVEHERMTEFRDKYLERFPDSLRKAANSALGQFDLLPSDEAMEEMSEEDRKLWAERQRNRDLREEEKRRVEGLMRECKRDLDLWELMEAEVFSLPEKLGIAPQSTGRKKRRTKKKTAEPKEEADVAPAEGPRTPAGEYIMDVHGPLYSHYINHALKLFDTAFTRPSPFAFQILPRVKSLGLTSYVLGASTPFYTALAGMHWDRYGDAPSALDTIQEISATGLYADAGVGSLLRRIRAHVASCSRGLQGPFVSAMMEAPPYDADLEQRLDDLESFTRYSINRYERYHGD